MHINIKKIAWTKNFQVAGIIVSILGMGVGISFLVDIWQGKLDLWFILLPAWIFMQTSVILANAITRLKQLKGGTQWNKF